MPLEHSFFGSEAVDEPRRQLATTCSCRGAYVRSVVLIDLYLIQLKVRVDTSRRKKPLWLTVVNNKIKTQNCCDKIKIFLYILYIYIYLDNECGKPSKIKPSPWGRCPLWIFFSSHFFPDNVHVTADTSHPDVEVDGLHFATSHSAKVFFPTVNWPEDIFQLHCYSDSTFSCVKT